jgi:hypothetical protein
MQKLKSKIPTRQEFFTVFSVIVFVVFSWTLYRMFYQVPSWLFYLSLTDILIILAYVLAFALLESLFLLGILILLTFFYPAKLYREKIVAQSVLILLVFTIAAVIYQGNVGMLKKWGLVELILFTLTFLASLTLLILVASFLLDRFAIFKRLLVSFAERMTVFAWIYVPLSVLGLVVVLVRNVFYG